MSEVFSFYSLCAISCCLSTICWKDYSFPFYCLSTLVENQLTIKVRVYFWLSNFSPLIYVYPWTRVPHCIDYCSLVVSLQLGIISFQLILCFVCFFLYLFWLFWVHTSTWIVGSACHSGKRVHWHSESRLLAHKSTELNIPIHNYLKSYPMVMDRNI